MSTPTFFSGKQNGRPEDLDFQEFFNELSPEKRFEFLSYFESSKIRMGFYWGMGIGAIFGFFLGAIYIRYF